MAKSTTKLVSSLRRMDTDIDVQWGRMSLMQRWLDEQSEQLDSLSARIEAGLARIDALLAKKLQ